MYIVIDIGNTNIVVGGIEDNEVIFTARLATNRKKTDLQYAIDLTNILDIQGMKDKKSEGCILSSVVPEITSVMKQASEQIFGGETMVLRNDLKNGLSFAVDRPELLGADRIADTVAVAAEYPLPAAVVDMGTATTFSVVDENHCFLGGVICPGVRISLDALTSRAAKLSGISLEKPETVVGKNTVSCMQSGVLYGNAALLDGVFDRIEAELGRPITCIATGGLSGLIVPQCRRKVIRDENLLLKGLCYIYQMNR